MNELNNLLTNEIKREFGELESVDSGSKEQTVAINNVIKLYRLKLDEAKSEAEIKKLNDDHALACKKQNQDLIENRAKRDDDLGLRAMEFDKQRKENIFKLCVSVAELVLPLMFYARWMAAGFKFETNGTFTSTTFRSLFTNFKPTKK